MKQHPYKLPAILLVLLLFLQGINWGCQYYATTSNGIEHQATTVQTILHKKEVRANAVLEELSTVGNLFALYHKQAFIAVAQDDIYLLAYENNKLIYWNSNNVDFAEQNYRNQSHRLIKLANGWYELIRKEEPQKNRLYIALLLIKKEYNYQNKFLKNCFQDGFDLNSKQIELTNAVLPGSIYSISGNFLFSIQFTKSGNDTSYTGISYFIDLLSLVIVGYLLILLFGFHKADSYTWQHSLFLGLTLFLLRFFMMYVKAPVALYHSDLFSPKSFASSFWLPSLGDFLLNTISALSIITLLHKKIRAQQIIVPNKKLVAILLLINAGAFIYVRKSIKTLIIDSTINLDLNNIFLFNQESIVALLIVALLYLSWGLINSMVLYLIKPFSLGYTILIHLLTTALVGFYIYYTDSLLLIDISLYGILVALLLLLHYYFKSSSNNLIFSSILLCTAYITFSLNTTIEQKENTYRKVLTEKLAEIQDPIAENLFTQLHTKLSNDTIFGNIINKGKNFKGDLKKTLTQKYFNGYWEKYNITPYLFTLQGEPASGVVYPTTKDISILEQTISTNGKPTFNNSLFYITNSNEQHYYLARIAINQPGKNFKIGTLYIAFEGKFISEEIGFPDLLLDKQVEENNVYALYSYARYKNGEIINKYGNFNYPLQPTVFEQSDRKEFFINLDSYNHYILNKSNKYLVVLSKLKRSFFYEITTYAYLLSFFTIIVIVYTVIVARKNLFFKFNNSFRSRIQLSFLFILIISFIALAYGTIIAIKTQYESNNKHLISEKVHSVLISLEQLLGSENNLESIDVEYLNYTLAKLSNVFYTDVNMYNLQGKLIASSRQKIVEQGIISTKINPEAYHTMIIDKKSEFITNEKIGNLNYLSAYLPFENNANKIVGYINLPYFAKQNELKTEIANFLVTVINVFLLLFGLSVILAVVLANRITSSLTLIKGKLSNIQLGKRNEHIIWKQNDEIGNLVKEYNKMIDELADSTDKLVQSEREGVWREMAKQIAHEIKNPLTPMKLSVQHLQRALKDKAEDWDKKFERTAQTLIDQIDTLSNIANEFSSFAKIPTADFVKIDLLEQVHKVVELYKAESNINFTIKQNIDSAIIRSDKDYIVRILNNIFKNAIQAIDKKENGQITINISKENNTITLAIKDNGCGIPEEMQEKLFTPYFTTKSTGTGLGLAMVKNMVEQSNGKIWFETELNKGTTFYVSFTTTI